MTVKSEGLTIEWEWWKQCIDCHTLLFHVTHLAGRAVDFWWCGSCNGPLPAPASIEL